jgi:hypothetical protein
MNRWTELVKADRRNVAQPRVGALRRGKLSPRLQQATYGDAQEARDAALDV